VRERERERGRERERERGREREREREKEREHRKRVEDKKRNFLKIKTKTRQTGPAAFSPLAQEEMHLAHIFSVERNLITRTHVHRSQLDFLCETAEQTCISLHMSLTHMSHTHTWARTRTLRERAQIKPITNTVDVPTGGGRAETSAPVRGYSLHASGVTRHVSASPNTH